jgi:hypothetical protein
MKPKIQPEDIEGMKFVDYRKLFFKELKRMKSEGKECDFILITEWEYPDFSGKEIPFMVVGSLNSPWEKYYKTDAKKRKSKDFAKGTCSFGKDTPDGQEFNVIIKHGKIKSKGQRALDKVLFKKVGLVLSIIDKAVEEDDDDDSSDDNATVETVAKVGTVASAVGANNGNAAKKPKEKVIEDVKEQAGELKDSLKALKTKFKGIKQKVAANLKKNKAGRKDLVMMRELQEAFNKFNETYEGAHEKLQKKFASAKKELEKQNKKFAKLALAVKHKKKTLAQQLADKFFAKTADRIATTEEVALMQTSLKAALDYRQISMREGEEKKLNIKAVYATAQHKGPQFQPRHTDVVYEKLMQG